MLKNLPTVVTPFEIATNFPIFPYLTRGLSALSQQPNVATPSISQSIE